MAGHAGGRLVFHDDRLVAVLVQLSEDFMGQSGKWHVEAAFGDFEALNGRLFNDLDAITAAIDEEGSRRSHD
ncbi:MAG: hypothetical protein AB7U47_17875 [Variibacter sp.]